MRLMWFQHHEEQSLSTREKSIEPYTSRFAYGAQLVGRYPIVKQRFGDLHIHGFIFHLLTTIPLVLELIVGFSDIPRQLLQRIRTMLVA